MLGLPAVESTVPVIANERSAGTALLQGYHSEPVKGGLTLRSLLSLIAVLSTRTADGHLLRKVGTPGRSACTRDVQGPRRLCRATPPAPRATPRGMAQVAWPGPCRDGDAGVLSYLTGLIGCPGSTPTTPAGAYGAPVPSRGDEACHAAAARVWSTPLLPGRLSTNLRCFSNGWRVRILVKRSAGLESPGM